MRKRRITIAAYDSTKKAREKADYICDGIDDQIEIQAAINMAADLKAIPKFMKGTYNISGAILIPED